MAVGKRPVQELPRAEEPESLITQVDASSEPLEALPLLRREKQTLIPPFDPESLAKEIEAAVDRPTITPPYDPSSYARIVDDHVERGGDGRDTPRTMTAATPGLGAGVGDDSTSGESAATIGRAMYGSYLSSDYPEAMVLAERVLAREPDHALALLVAKSCRDRLGSTSDAPRLSPSSVVRLKGELVHHLAELVRSESDIASKRVLGHVDGVADVAMLAILAGIPRPEALDRLHALLDLGVLEVVNG